MCPSYRATRRGGALHAGPGPAAVRDARRPRRLPDHATAGAPTAVRDALDLCLACKGCKTDCPVNVDMATYKAEFLVPPLRRHGCGPAAHYSMGWLPLWRADRRARASALVNALTHAPGLRQARQAAAAASTGTGEMPLLRRRAASATGTGAAARARAVSTGARCCCGRTPSPTTSTRTSARPPSRSWRRPAGGSGCRTAAAVLRPDLDLHRPARHRQAGAAPHRTDPAPRCCAAACPVVGLEPSCTAVFRDDAPELFPHDRDVARLREQTVTLAELLTEHPPGLAARPPTRTAPRSPSRTATSTPFWATTPTGSC